MFYFGVVDFGKVELIRVEIQANRRFLELGWSFLGDPLAIYLNEIDLPKKYA